MLTTASTRHPSFSLMVHYHLLELARESGIPLSAGVQRLQPLFLGKIFSGSMCIIVKIAPGCPIRVVRDEQ